MKTLTKFLSFFCLCLLATGCVIEAPTLPNHDDPQTTCGIDEITCASGQICAVVDPCGFVCPDAGPEDACQEVCIELLACVTPLNEEDTCDPFANHCSVGLECQIDESAGCGPTDCDAEECGECPPIFTCQVPERPRTCEELDCGPGFRCELVFDGCGYSEPDCEALPWQTPVCVPVQGIEECEPQLVDECAWNETCKADYTQCIPSRCDGDICTNDCRIPFTCQPITCDDLECPESSRCEAIQVDHHCSSEEGCNVPAYVELICVPNNGHIIGDSCDETRCLLGHSCVETHVYLPCDGPECDEPADVHVSCELDDRPLPPPHSVERCDTDSDCGEGFECRHDEATGCEPSFCDGEVCTQDCVSVFTCQPVEEPLPPTPEPHPEPYPADECDSNWDCGEGFECRFDQETVCRPSFCDGDFCTRDCVDLFTCQPVEEPQPPETLVNECDPSADDCDSGFSCEVDDNAPCEPSYCDEDVCTDDCRVIFTCQPE